MIEGRAQTPEQKREVIEQLYQLWMRRPTLRFGQMLLNWANGHKLDFYGVEDFQLVESLKAFYDEMDKWTGEPQFNGLTMHVEVDGKVIAEHVSTVDVRELLRKQQEKERERRILLDMAYRNCEE